MRPSQLEKAIRRKHARLRRLTRSPKKGPPSVSPLAPDAFPGIPHVAGVCFASVAAGVRYQGRDDVMLAVMDPGTSMAGVFTRSSTRAAPVLDCEAKIDGQATGGAAIIVNAGNANAFTGTNGRDAVTAITGAVAAITGIDEARVFSASTGVIGELLAHDRITGKLEELANTLTPDGIERAAGAIRTTDTFAKGAYRQVEIDGQMVTIAGFAKGSGMIAPDMATMLGFVFTDAKVGRAELQSALDAATGQSFNAITVDSDTSTSDTVLLAATGASGVDASDSPAFQDALTAVLQDLAHQIVRDGEGATKFVTVQVTGADTREDADLAARAIANSPLVKTAIAGEDPNWGRVVMAVGKSGAKADRDTLSIWFGDELVAEKGWISPTYSEDRAAKHMAGDEITIRADLGLGLESATVWTCDLTHGYISINADYRS